MKSNVNMNIGSWDGVNEILIKVCPFKSREASEASYLRGARLTKKAGRC